MPQIINTNIASLNAQRNLNASQRDQETSLQRLSSGLRINSAKDDAAGLAISTRFNSQINGTNVAVRNSGDAISLAQTAEGALDSINSSLQRVRELALQSANDTNTGLDRQALQEEVDQLIAEIQSVAEKSNFNGKNLLDGSFTDSVFQTGANVGDTVAVSIERLDTSTLGSAQAAGVTSNVQSTPLVVGTSTLELAAGDLVINGFAVGASSGSTDNASSDLKSSSAIAKAAAINAVSADTGVTATAQANTVEGTNVTTITAAGESLVLNGVAINLEVGDAGNLTEVQNQLGNVAETINSKADATGVTAAVVSTNTGFRIDLTAEDGRNIAIEEGTDTTVVGLAAGGGAGTENVFVGNVTLSSTDGTDIELSSNTVNIDNAGFEEGTYNGLNASVVGDASDDTARAALTSGDLLINGVDVGPTLAGDDAASTGSESASAIALAAAINRISDDTLVTARADENSVYSAAVTAAAVTGLTINGVTVNAAAGTDLSDQVSKIVTAVNDVSGQSGVTAEVVDGDQYRLVAEDGRNIVIGGTVTNSGLTADTYIAGVVLEAAGEFELGTNTGDIERTGLAVGTYGGTESGTRISELDITTVQGATEAITAVDNAINTVASQRAQLGAVQNRFESTISNLEIAGENLSSANSRIQDADFAAETAALSRSQVLQQAGISILAQANARPQQALSLLQ